MTRVRVRCVTCASDQARLPAAVTLLLRMGKPPAYAFVCINCGDENEKECPDQATVERLMEARCPIEHDAATVSLMAGLKADLEETT